MVTARLCLVAGFLLGGAALQAQLDAGALFAEANDLFRQANQARASDPQGAAALYRRAAVRYENLISDRGIVNSKLHYNAGNAYFQFGDLGRAILNYRKAARLDPSDSNVTRNLQHARSLRQDRLEPAAASQVLETLLFWHYDVSRSTRTRLFAVLWVLFWSLLLLRKLGKAWVPWELAIAAGAVGALLVGSLAVDAYADQNTVAGVIVAPETVARQGDGSSYEPSFEEPLHAGVEFRVLEERPDWHQVELPDGRQCWLPARDIELVR